uniref:Protein artemis n=1 Tax=Sander lucioperca TaxID=283035 RepID=A0A8C9Y6F1_SANLU
MSSFAGRMKEYPTLSLDRFDRENLHARAYFLSHCHKGEPLLEILRGNFRLYCSFVTKELLLSNPKYAFWGEYIVPLELESPTQISLVDEASGEKEEIVVTLLPAGHCPGSVMFLFEGSRGNVLYTGDFRLAAGDVSRIEHLHSGSRVKDIQSVYLDSTFYDPRFYQIPTREVCLNGISELVGNWISQSSYHVVWLNCKAAYGYEYLFTNLGEEFNTQIHVKNLAMFKKMPEILNYVTTDRRTQIHACRHPRDEEFFQGSRLPCGCTASDGTPLRIISIKPSTMWFGERMKKTNVIIKTGASSFRACFSFHSSYSEIKNFLSYLQPVNIYPSVIPIGRTLTEVTQIPQKTAPPVSVEESFPLTVADAQPVARNYVDCTESNDEEEDEGEEEENEGKEDTKLTKEEVNGTIKGTEKKMIEVEGSGSSNPPKWEDFFTTETLTDSQNSLTSQLQSCCSVPSSSPSKTTGSQTPDLFSDEEETPDNFSLTLSASLSNHSSQNQDSYLPDTLILHTEQRGREQGDSRTNTVSQEKESNGQNIQSELEELSESQASSDFDIPCTPESKIPQTDELSQLYRKLASGEEVVIRKGSQGSM